MPGDSIRVMLLVTDALEKMGVPYAVGGSLSSSLHGVMRSTLDVDIVADWSGVPLRSSPMILSAAST